MAEIRYQKKTTWRNFCIISNTICQKIEECFYSAEQKIASTKFCTQMCMCPIPLAVYTLYCLCYLSFTWHSSLSMCAKEVLKLRDGYCKTHENTRDYLTSLKPQARAVNTFLQLSSLRLNMRKRWVNKSLWESA